MVHRSAFAIALAFALAACGQSAEAPASQPAPAEQLTWDTISSGEGSALVLQREGGFVVLNIACLNAPPRMRVSVPDFSEISSEERLSFGADSEPFVFVAQLGDAEPGVAAERDVSLDLAERLLNARTIAVNYGAQNAGPYAAPPREVAEIFVTACRDIAGS